jgi:hypothetical protein
VAQDTPCRAAVNGRGWSGRNRKRSLGSRAWRPAAPVWLGQPRRCRGEEPNQGPKSVTPGGSIGDHRPGNCGADLRDLVSQLLPGEVVHAVPPEPCERTSVHRYRSVPQRKARRAAQSIVASLERGKRQQHRDIGQERTDGVRIERGPKTRCPRWSHRVRIPRNGTAGAITGVGSASDRNPQEDATPRGRVEPHAAVRRHGWLPGLVKGVRRVCTVRLPT